MKKSPVIVLLLAAMPLALLAGDDGAWSPKAAAAYLDQRAAWWVTWPTAARDHGTFCVSCHTALPYALGRPSLRGPLNEQGLSITEHKLIDNVVKRVRIWDEALPFYNDEKNGVPKTTESRGTESVLNALILSSYDARESKFSDDTRKAFDNMWRLQIKSGEFKGALPWLNFQNEPWEADDSQFWGAALAAIANGNTPARYRSEPDVKAALGSLAEYLRRNMQGQSLLNRAVLLWAAAGVSGILQPADRSAIVNELLAKQEADGGWRTASIVIGTWKRRDSTPFDPGSDGYASGLVSLALERAGVPNDEPHLKNAIAWLARNQDKKTGQWHSTSLNKQRDLSSDAGRFMSDAATAYSVLALTGSQ